MSEPLVSVLVPVLDEARALPGLLDHLAGLAGRFEAIGVSLERQLAPAGVLGDPGRLHQVITNLLTNAMKFTPAGGHVTLRTGLADDNAWLELSSAGALPGSP